MGELVSSQGNMSGVKTNLIVVYIPVHIVLPLFQLTIFVIHFVFQFFCLFFTGRTTKAGSAGQHRDCADDQN
uniref:Uncharacterized protein n=1 Tax=Anguilla anguilla TaxID=7936 RepID=A0A0E9R1D1_ANGAN